MVMAMDRSTRPLPDGVWFDQETGKYMHFILQHTGFFDAEDNRLDTPDKVREVRRKGGEVFEEHAKIPRECRVASSLDEAAIRLEQKAARVAEIDFYHPVWGLLTGGRKRTKDHPANLGTGAIQRDRVRTTVQTSSSAPSPDAAPEAARNKRGAAHVPTGDSVREGV